MFIFDHIVHATAIPIFMAFNDDDDAADRRLAVMEVILPSSGNNVSVISDSKGSNGDEIFASAEKRNIKKSIRLCSYVGLATCFWSPELKLDHGVVIHINDHLILLFKMVT